MTVVVGVRKSGRVVLATNADTYFGDERAGDADYAGSKIRPVGDALVSWAGWERFEDTFDDFLDGAKRSPALRTRRDVYRFFLELWRFARDERGFVNDQPHDDDDPGHWLDVDSDFLVAAPAPADRPADGPSLFRVGSDLSVTPFNRFHAVGSGRRYALGAAHLLYDQLDDPAEIARRAVETAAHFDVYSAGGPRLQSIPASP